MNRIFILTDYMDKFNISLDEKTHFYSSMNTSKMKELFEKEGVECSVLNFSELDLSLDFKGDYFLYQTSEDIGQYYRSYITDVLLVIKSKGGILLPNFDYYYAHHNKCYMELMRSQFKNEELKSIKSRVYGTLQDGIDNENEFPVVIKCASGSASQGIYLCKDKKEFIKNTKKITKCERENKVKKLLIFLKHKFIDKANVESKETIFRKKYIVQDFVPNLNGDYKVLYFGGKYYTLYRKNRENDFRASGGGRLFVCNEEEEKGLLDFAKKVVEELDFTIIGMDIAFDGEKYHLLEYQFIHLGPYTLQTAEYYLKEDNGSFVRIYEKSDLETEFVRSILLYIKEKYNG